MRAGYLSPFGFDQSSCKELGHISCGDFPNGISCHPTPLSSSFLPKYSHCSVPGGGTRAAVWPGGTLTPTESPWGPGSASPAQDPGALMHNSLLILGLSQHLSSALSCLSLLSSHPDPLQPLNPSQAATPTLRSCSISAARDQVQLFIPLPFPPPPQTRSSSLSVTTISLAAET